MLHGCMQSASDFASGTGMNEVADELGFLVLYPEQAASANLARCWTGTALSIKSADPVTAALIAALTRQVLASAGTTKRGFISPEFRLEAREGARGIRVNSVAGYADLD